MRNLIFVYLFWTLATNASRGVARRWYGNVNSSSITNPLNFDNVSNAPVTQQKISGKQNNRDPGSNGDDGKIIFPTDETIPTCENLTYCEDVPNYPRDLVNAVLREHKDIKLVPTVQDMILDDVIHRSNFQPEDVSLCQSYEKVVYPKVAKNRDEKWQYVVNQGDFTQGVRVETCENENSECALLEGMLPLGYKSKCKQKYIYRQLMTVSTAGQVKPDMFRFPSSCCCVLEFASENPLWRFGPGKNANVTPVV